MVTEPGYTLDMDQISFYVNGQAVSNGGSVVITDSSAAMTSLVYCTAIPETPATDPEPSLPESHLHRKFRKNRPLQNHPFRNSHPHRQKPRPCTAICFGTAGTGKYSSGNRSSCIQNRTGTGPASEPIAAEPIASAVVTEDEEVDLSTIHPEVTASAVTSSSQLQPQRRLYHLSEQQTRMHRLLLRKLQLFENAAQTENTQTAHTGIGSWFHQRTNQILAVMIAVILLLILIDHFWH